MPRRLVWDVFAPVGSDDSWPDDPEIVWRTLAAADSALAFAMMKKLAATPAQAVPRLRQRLRPAVTDPKLLARLVVELDHAQFTARRQAASELEQLGELAEPMLKKVLAGQPSPETRKSVEQILKKLNPHQPPDLTILRNLRAVEVLEQVGTREARQLLQTLTGGAAGARLTVVAHAALARLAKRPVARPLRKTPPTPPS